MTIATCDNLDEILSFLIADVKEIKNKSNYNDIEGMENSVATAQINLGAALQAIQDCEGRTKRTS